MCQTREGAPQGFQVLLGSGFSFMTFFHPGGASGVLLKSNGTSSAVYTGIHGLHLDILIKSNVNVHCFSREQKKKTLGIEDMCCLVPKWSDFT